MIVATGSKYPDETARMSELYDIGRDEWVEGPMMKSPRHYHSTVVIDDRVLYVFGGRDSTNETPLASIEMLNLEKDELHWVSLEVINKNNDWTARETVGTIALN
jgi:hypothetical protein